MADVTIQTEETPEPAKRDDAAFAAGEVVGEFRAHMSATESKLRELKESAARATATSQEAASMALEAQVVATVAAVEASAAPEPVADEPPEGEIQTGPITELESPTIDVEDDGEKKDGEEAEEHKGRDKWSLW
jgi:Sec-independent protein translocase protein TatA